MTSRKGGYIIIDLTSTTLVDDLKVALSFGKPVLVYNANNEANFYTLSYDDDNDLYILNGAKDSFSVDDDGDITPIVPVAPSKIYKHDINLIDGNGNLTAFTLYASKSTALTYNEILTNIGSGWITAGCLITDPSSIEIGYVSVATNNIIFMYTIEDSITYTSESTLTDTIVEI